VVRHGLERLCALASAENGNLIGNVVELTDRHEVLRIVDALTVQPGAHGCGTRASAGDGR
jgi:hypothetical protein